MLRKVNTDETVDLTLSPEEARKQLQACKTCAAGLKYLTHEAAFIAESSPHAYVELTNEFIDRKDVNGHSFGELQDSLPIRDVFNLIRSRAVALMMIARLADAMEGLQAALAIAEKMADMNSVQTVRMYIATTMIHSNRVVEGVQVLEEIRSNLPEKGESEAEYEFAMHLHLAQGYHMLGRYYEAQSECEAILIKNDNPEEPDRFRHIYSLLGIINSSIGNFSSARDYFGKAIELSREMKSDLLTGKELLNAILLRIELEEYTDDTLTMLEEAERLLQNSGDDRAKIGIQLNFALLHSKRQNYDLAGPYARRALEMAERLEIGFVKCSATRLMAITTFHQGQTEQALELAKESLELSIELELPDSQLNAYSSLAEFHNLIGQYKKAFEYSQLASSIAKTLQSQKFEERHADLQRSFAVKTSRYEAARATSEAKLHKLQAEKAASEMKLMRNEVVAKALHISQKNELLQSIKQSVQEARDHEDSTRSEAILTELLRNLELHLADDHSWQTFEEGFKLLYPTFMENISKQYPKLTVNDIRICALMHLKLTAKDICRIAAIAPRSIESYRYRIRKKIGLDSSIDLTSFLSSIDSGYASTPEIAHN